MNLTLDCSLRELLRQALEYNSLHNILYTLADIERIIEPEEWANHCIKLSNNGEDIE